MNKDSRRSGCGEVACSDLTHVGDVDLLADGWVKSCENKESGVSAGVKSGRDLLFGFIFKCWRSDNNDNTNRRNNEELHSQFLVETSSDQRELSEAGNFLRFIDVENLNHIFGDFSYQKSFEKLWCVRNSMVFQSN